MINSLPSFERKPILFFSEGISYAHIARSIIIVRWLKSLDYPLIVACTENSSHFFEEEKVFTTKLITAKPAAIYQRLRSGKAMYATEELLNYLPQDEELIERVKPQLIVSEFRFSALQLAKKMGIASVGITEATCHPNFTLQGTTPDPFAKPKFIPLEVFDWLQTTPLGKNANQQIVKKLSLSLRSASQAYGLEILPTFFDYASQGDLCLLCDHPELIPITPLRSQDYYTGALLWERSQSLPSELTNLDRKKKTIYICLGTQESLPSKFLEPYVKELLKHNLQVIISRGKRDFKFALKDEDLYVFDFINESKLLSLVDLIVYPGGAMSTYQALSCKVPLLALPAHANQHFYSEAIVRNNLGYFFRPSRLKITTLVTTTLELLENTQIKKSLALFQPKLQNYSQKKLIIDSIARLI